MKKNEFLEFVPTGDNVILHAIPFHKSGIIIPGKEENVDIDTHDIVVLAVGSDCKWVHPGDSVIPTGASLVRMPIEGLSNNEFIFYTKESMIKFVRSEEGIVNDETHN